MDKKIGINISAVATGFLLCLTSDLLLFWFGQLSPGNFFAFYYAGFNIVFGTFITGIICFVLLLLVEKMIRRFWHIKILDGSFYFVLAVSILFCAGGIALYEGTRDEFGEVVFFLIMAAWMTVGMLYSFAAFYRGIKESFYDSWYKNKSFYFAFVFMIINIIWVIVCS